MLSSVFIENPQPEDITSSVMSDFFDKWHGLHCEGGLPGDQSIQLTDFGYHLPFMVQHKYETDSQRFLVKFYGSGYVDGGGTDHTGRFVDEIPRAESLLARCMWVVENKQPYLSLNNEVVWSSKKFKYYNVLGCPLFDDSKRVSGLLFRIEFI